MTPPIHTTSAEVFILESLSEANEEAGLFEGRILYKTLKMAGKNPIYYYFRTKEELELLAYTFRDSGYRYLHISCHGDLTHIHTTLNRISYQEFGDIFSGLLRNRRLFMSACSTGNEIFSTCISVLNKGMYSIAAPVNDIRFDQAYAFWTAFYTKAHLMDQNLMKSKYIYAAFSDLCKFFEIDFHWSRYNPKHDIWFHKIFGR
ncbi:hypothetical protein [Aeromonas sp. R7-5]|uniref:hypothetical protein n=1 Tax=Aeromonas sp. R7-5 TaxID=3138477 RepID=UPI0034A28AD3